MDLPLYELKVSLDELKQLAEKRGIKGFKSMSKERLLSAFSKPKLIKNNFDNERLWVVKQMKLLMNVLNLFCKIIKKI